MKRERLEFLADNPFYTKRFAHYVGRRCRSATIKDIAQELNLDLRVSPLEVEELLHESGLVAEVAVMGKAHEMRGDEIWAVVVPRPGDGEDIVRRLTDYSRKTMSPYMMPQRYVVKDALPKTTTGKTDYPALKAEIHAT